MDYKPSASLDNACERAHIYARIRSFFLHQGVLEVETPILSHASVTDVHLRSVVAQFHQQDRPAQGYLQTSPEFAMKRLLATWKQPIYQITKVFRDNELGKRHNIEFTMLEWYRPNSSLDELIKELNLLVNEILKTQTMFERVSYKQVFLDHALVDPFTTTIDELEQTARFFEIETDLYRDLKPMNYMAHREQELDIDTTLISENVPSIDIQNNCPEYGYLEEGRTHSKPVESTQSPHQHDSCENNLEEELKETWLELLYSHVVEPKLGQILPTIVYHFPASQASLAKVTQDSEGNQVAKRFELYIEGLEIANAYDELSDSAEQLSRFEADNSVRAEKQLPTIPMDNHLLNALEDMPESVGIAVGIDRLVMLASKTNDIADVINFTTEHS